MTDHAIRPPTPQDLGPGEGYLPHLATLNARQFQIAIRRLADDLSYGTDSSRYKGAGIEYVQSRPYLFGDPVKAIDWRVTARTARVHIKEYEAPKRMPCWLCIDTSASMTLSSTGRSKYELALHIAGGLALACLDRVSPVGIVGVGTREVREPLSLSRDRILQWLLRLRRFRWDEGTALGRRIHELRPSLRSRALVIVLSDLQDRDGVPALRLLAQEHDVAVLQLQDPAEILLRGTGFVRAREAETGRPFIAHGRKPWLDQPLIEAGLRKGGVDHLLVRTDRPFVQRLRHFFRARGLFMRGAR
jgi:uncharacterized protein (DUF58 family)